MLISKYYNKVINMNERIDNWINRWLNERIGRWKVDGQILDEEVDS